MGIVVTIQSHWGLVSHDLQSINLKQSSVVAFYRNQRYYWQLLQMVSPGYRIQVRYIGGQRTRLYRVILSTCGPIRRLPSSSWIKSYSPGQNLCLSVWENCQKFFSIRQMFDRRNLRLCRLFENDKLKLCHFLMVSTVSRLLDGFHPIDAQHTEMI